MAMFLQIRLPETGRGMARRAPNPTESFYEVFWIIKFSFLREISSSPESATPHQKTLCYSKSEEMMRHSIRLLLHYLKFWDVPVP